MQILEVNGVRLAVTVSGDPAGMPLVLLHGGGDDRSVWDRVSPAFSATHRVYAVDLRGHGDSDRPGEYSFELMRDDVLALCDAIGAQRADLIGHSMGGSVAWLVAQERPERVAHLVIVDTLVPKPGASRLTLPPRPDAELPFDWDALAAIIAQVNDPDPRWWERIPTVTAPTLILAGGPESRFAPDQFADTLTLLKDGRVVEIPVGHGIHRDAPEEFLAAVVPFLT